jgi:hypothetical protein
VCTRDRHPESHEPGEGFWRLARSCWGSDMRAVHSNVMHADSAVGGLAMLRVQSPRTRSGSA